MNPINERFKKLCEEEPERSEGVLAIKLLTSLIEENTSNNSTIQGLQDLLNDAIAQMLRTETSNSSVKSVSELFQRFITLTILDSGKDFELLRKELITRAHIFLKKVECCRDEIASHTLCVLHDGQRVLVHAKSRVVISALERAVITCQRRNIHCFVTMTAPRNEGQEMYQCLKKLGISCTLIHDTALGYIMPQIDAVLLGAEAVVENGGILNRMGTSTIAMIAHVLGKPVYVLAESFKFVRSYVLDQRHIPEEYRLKRDNSSSATVVNTNQVEMDQRIAACPFEQVRDSWQRLDQLRVNKIETEIPVVDYTKPMYITHLFTDLGILTPSAVSDELIKLYL